MTFALNTSHPLYGNLKMLIGVNESNALVDLVTPSRTITPVSGSAFGTGTYGRHFGVRHSGDYIPYGADLSPSFKPANNTGTLLLVLNAFTFATYDGSSVGSAFFIGKPYVTSYDASRSLPMLAVHSGSGKASGNSSNSSTGFQTITADMTTALAAGMFTLTRNGTTAYALYANGTTTPEVSGTALGDNTTATGEYTYIGGSTYAAMDFNIVYACWFDSVLTTTQISDLYTSLGASNAFALLASADTTAPVLTSPTGTATGSTTASGTISTDTAEGTLYFLASTNATETAATVKAASSQSVTTTGSQSVSFTGLTASAAYYAHYCHRDVAGNDSTVANSTSFTTSAPSDTTPPTLTGSITPSAITTTGFTISWSAGSDDTAVTGYEYSTNGGSTYTDAGNVLTKAVTGLSPGTAYSVKVRAYDAAANKSTPLGASVTTAVGTITSPALKNNTGTLLASETGVVVNVYNSTTGALVVRKTGLTSDTSGIVAIADAALVPGTSYAYEVVLAANGRRLPVETAT